MPDMIIIHLSNLWKRKKLSDLGGHTVASSVRWSLPSGCNIILDKSIIIIFFFFFPQILSHLATWFSNCNCWNNWIRSKRPPKDILIFVDLNHLGKKYVVWTSTGVFSAWKTFAIESISPMACSLWKFTFFFFFFQEWKHNISF